MKSTEQACHIFGVRHLSPAGAFHLLQFLNEIKPKRVLIEGPSCADELIGDIVSKSSKPPIAILAYTEDMPVRTLVYTVIVFTIVLLGEDHGVPFIYFQF